MDINARLHPRSGSWVVGAILVLGIVVIAVPLVFLIAARVTTSFPTTGLSTDQKGNLSSIEVTGEQALSLTSIVEFVLGASIVLGALFLIVRMRA